MNSKNTLGTSNTTFVDYLSQIHRVHKDEIFNKALARETYDWWNDKSIDKDMKRINHSEHMVELGCLSY